MIYQEVSGSDFRDQSIINGVRSSTTFLETTSEVHNGCSQSISDWLQIDQHRESEFAHDSDAERFHNWRHDEGWMQCRSLFVSASSGTREVIPGLLCHAEVPFIDVSFDYRLYRNWIA
jgi:hypothetical protein